MKNTNHFNIRNRIEHLTMIMFLILACISMLPGCSGIGKGNTTCLVVESPDRSIQAELSLDSDGNLRYRIIYEGSEILAPSRLGIVANSIDLGSNVRLGKPVSAMINETYTVIGVHNQGINYCNMISVPVKRTGKSIWLDVRAYNDGVALRFRLPAKSGRHIDGEVTEWQLPVMGQGWYQDKIIGYEGIFTHSLINEFKPEQIIPAPLTVILPGGIYVMITEANVVDYGEMSFRVSPERSFLANLHADPSGWTTDSTVIQPWRVTLIARDLNSLVNSDLIQNLCPSPTPELADASWIKPGRCGWSWWSEGEPVIYEEELKWINWTQQLGFEYYLVDAGWKEWNENNQDAWTCLRNICDYGKSVGVKIWLWVDSKDIPDEAARIEYFARAKEVGIAGVKIDFMPPASYYWVNWYDETLRDAANEHLLVDFHGATKPTGRNRTWPNELTRESIRGHEYHILRYQRTNPPQHDVILPFTRYVIGPGDYTPTVFDPAELRGYTWSRELAQAIVFTSPFLCYGGHLDDFLKNDAVDVLKEIPAVWDETVVLPVSEIGKCAAFARRKGKDWFIGVISGNESLELDLPLNFLGPGNFNMLLLEDHPTRDDAWEKQKKTVTMTDHIITKIRPGGGLVVQITHL